MNNIKISASILAANPNKIEEEINRLNFTSISAIHVDIMDGSFVSNTSFNKNIIKIIRKYTSIPIEVHLMVVNPEKYIDYFIEEGSDTIIFHYESTQQPMKVIEKVRMKNINIGIALRPDTSEKLIIPLYSKIDTVIIMTVQPGYCRQRFMYSQLTKIANISKYTNKYPNLKIGVDGGIDNNTAYLCYKNGAETFIIGSYIFDYDLNYQNRISTINTICSTKI